ncbi:hypothetical protein ACWEN3_40230 [Streptomyces sp. NPDC004561]
MNRCHAQTALLGSAVHAPLSPPEESRRDAVCVVRRLPRALVAVAVLEGSVA